MRISNNYNINNNYHLKRPSFQGFRITSPAKRRIDELEKVVPFPDLWRFHRDLSNAMTKFKEFKKDDLVLYIKNGNLCMSYFMRDDVSAPYATAVLNPVDEEHVTRFARKIRQYTEYAEFFDDSTAFLKKDVPREFV